MPLTKFLKRKEQSEHYKGFERRKYARVSFNQPLRFKVLNPIFLKEFQTGKTKNISQNGMLFKTVTPPPPRKAYIVIETDRKTLSTCIQIDRDLMMIDGKITGKVMRTHLNLENGLFEVGIRFIHPLDNNRSEIEELLP